MELGADVIDINESLPYARKVEALRQRIGESGIAVLSACSAVSAVAAALVRHTRIERPARISALVAPASRETAHEATLRALLASVGAPIEVWRGGRFARAIGWRESRRFALPGRRGYLVESALALHLPALWPSLRDVDTWTDTSTPGANAILSLIALAPAIRRLAGAAVPLGRALARTLGTPRGGFGLEIESGAGEARGFWLSAERGSYRIAAAPAALAARTLAAERATERGLVPADRQLDEEELLAYLEGLGIAIARTPRVRSDAPQRPL
jgi:hypothetical protein